MSEILEDILYFFSFQDSTINAVLAGTVLLGIASGLLGVLVVLNKKALIVDAIAHSILPGICIGFLLAGTKNPVLLLSGGILTGALSVWLVQWIPSITKIKNDAAIAISLSTLFAFGVIGLNIIQNTGNPNQSGLNDYLFGKAATIGKEDLFYFGIISILVCLLITLFYNTIKTYLFDRSFSNAIGLPSKTIAFMLNTFIIIITAIGIRTVGIVLMSAMIIAPAIAARFWSHKLHRNLILAGIFGGCSALIGVFISFLAPNMPTGPWIVCALASIAFTSIFFAPTGIIKSRINLLQNRKQILNDNILKTFYKSAKSKKDLQIGMSKEDILVKRSFNIAQLEKGLASLKRKNLLVFDGIRYHLTNKGITESRRIVRLHRLWELYLQEYMNLAPDHVHESAESIEHILTPDLERQLLKIMGKPLEDPHQKEIPYEE
jgi:manganese/zinc/iron transport system permease protein